MLELAIRPMPVSYHVINRSKGTELPEEKTLKSFTTEVKSISGYEFVGTVAYADANA